MLAYTCNLFADQHCILWWQYICDSLIWDYSLVFLFILQVNVWDTTAWTHSMAKKYRRGNREIHSAWPTQWPWIICSSLGSWFHASSPLFFLLCSSTACASFEYVERSWRRSMIRMEDCGNSMEPMLLHHLLFLQCGVDSLRNSNRRTDFCVSETMKLTMKLVRYLKLRVAIISCIKPVMTAECPISVRRSTATIKSDPTLNRPQILRILGFGVPDLDSIYTVHKIAILRTCLCLNL